MPYGPAITNRQTFLRTVGDEDDDLLVLVACFTTWCPRCRAVAPEIDKLSNQYNSENSENEGTKKKVAFVKMNIEVAEDVAMEYGIQMVPSFLLFKGGEKVDEVSGPRGEKVREMIEKNLG